MVMTWDIHFTGQVSIVYLRHKTPEAAKGNSLRDHGPSGSHDSLLEGN